jgi:putative transcriptional regulator
LFSPEEWVAAEMKNRIRELRTERGWRQEDLAQKAGVTRQTINAIENDKYNPTLVLAMKLARLLNIPVEDLFQFKG